jgi:CheY-like chemotaxis protein
MSQGEFGGDQREMRLSMTAMHMRRARRVLVVDDDSEIRRLIAVSLALEGFDVTTAVDGQDCLGKALETAPDVITLDAMMPRLDGMQTAARLRGYPPTSFIKLVLITAAEEPQGDLADSAIDAYLGKPFDPAEMIRVVRRLAGAAVDGVGDQLRGRDQV